MTVCFVMDNTKETDVENCSREKLRNVLDGSPPRKVSDEQREAARERFVKMWAEKQESGFAEEIPEDLMEEFLEEEI